MTLTERLALRLGRPVDHNTQARARVHLADWLACVAGGIGEAPGRGAVPPLARAGLAASVLEMDDVHRGALLHPGPVVWTALFLHPGAGQRAMDGLLEAGVRGYEAMIALGEAMDAHHYARWHPTATMGGAGAAAATAALDGAGPEVLADAMGHALSLAGGLWRTRHEPAAATKQLHVLAAARTGLLAGEMALAGLKGPRAILEGEQGLFQAMTRHPRADVFDDAQQRWRIHEVSLKPWPACRHVHPAIDAVLALAEAGHVGAGADGPPIALATYADALSFADRAEPATAGEMRFSLQHGAAVALARGRAMTVADFDPQVRGADPLLAALRQRIRVEEEPALSAAYPAHFGARARTAHAEMLVADALGDPERPLEIAGRRAKAAMLLAHAGLTAADPAGMLDTLVDAPSGAPIVAALQAWLA